MACADSIALGHKLSLVVIKDRTGVAGGDGDVEAVSASQRRM